MKDLADYAYPLTDLFAQPTSSDQWDRYRLSQEQIDFFHENGYLAGVQLLDEKQIAVLSQALDEVMDPPLQPWEAAINQILESDEENQ